MSGQRPHNLPVQPSSLIGREDEIAAVSEALRTTPLLTMIGSGGVGKTRLALAVADQVWSHYPDGAWLVELAPVSDPALVPKTIASVLQIPEQARRDVTGVLADALRSRTLLLILDNCEHLVQACAQTVDALLRGCPQCESWQPLARRCGCQARASGGCRRSACRRMSLMCAVTFRRA